ncbi:MAG: hypothetical protein WCK16_03990 [Candidatus Moraniibacteriota bacterium]
MIKKISNFLINKKEPIVSGIIITIFLLGLMLRLVYLSYTGPMERTHDVSGHLDYINLLSNGTMPGQDQCWECFHPPLYYLCGAVIVKICHFLSLSDILTNIALQYFSLFLFSIFLIISFFVFKKFLNKNKVLLILAWLLLVFWPSGIIHSIRIGNDTMFYLFSILSLWFLLEWNEKDKFKYLIAALLTTLFCIYTKSSGLVMLFVIIVTVSLKWFFKKNESVYFFMKNKGILLIIAVFFAAIPSFINFINFKAWGSENSSWFISNAHSLPNQLVVNNNIENFLRFDFETFLRAPFCNPWDDASGRQFYLVTILKNSLWGELRNGNNNVGVDILALTENVLLFLLVILVFLGSLFLKDSFWRKKIILVFYGIALVVSSIFMRLIAPFSCANDFRYIFPILIPAIIILVSVLRELKMRKFNFLVWVGYVVIIIFSICSAIFFISGFGKLIT